MRRTLAIGVMLISGAACGDSAARDSGPAPSADHQTSIRTVYDRVIGERNELASPSAFRFAPPVPGRVAAWHWEPQEDGREYTFGHRRGWCVEFDATPHFSGYPPQPAARRMAFFAAGALRGIFAPSGNNAPLELDAWAPMWIAPWVEAAPARPQ